MEQNLKDKQRLQSQGSDDKAKKSNLNGAKRQWGAAG